MADLAGFATWLKRRGRAADTVALYRRHLVAALPDPEARLLDRQLAPKTRRVVKAALKSWAKFTGNGELLQRLDDLRLPAPARKAPKLPLTRSQWDQLVAVISSSQTINSSERAVLGLLAERGFRVGDVLRMHRDEIEGALNTGVLTFVAKGERRLEYRAKPVKRFLQILSAEDKWTYVRDLIAPGAHKDRRQASAVLRIERALHRVADEAGLSAEKIHPHRLRRTYAVLFLRKLKGDPEAFVKLMKTMQWQSITTAASYVDYVSADELAKIEDELFDD